VRGQSPRLRESFDDRTMQKRWHRRTLCTRCRCLLTHTVTWVRRLLARAVRSSCRRPPGRTGSQPASPVPWQICRQRATPSPSAPLMSEAEGQGKVRGLAVSSIPLTSTLLTGRVDTSQTHSLLFLSHW